MLWRVGAQADPRALLLYNDYGVGEVCPKSDAMAAHLERMLAAGVPVHGVGLQSHLRCAGMPDLSSVFENASRLAALGLGVCISELDLRVRGVPGAARPSAVGRDPPPGGLLLADAAAGAFPPPSPSTRAGSSAQVADIQRRCVRNYVLAVALGAREGATRWRAASTRASHSARCPGFLGVTLWGVTDQHSWVHSFFGADAPLLLDSEFCPKPAVRRTRLDAAGRGSRRHSLARCLPSPLPRAARSWALRKH